MKKLTIIALVITTLISSILIIGCTDYQPGERAQMLQTQATETIQHSTERDIFMGYLKECSDPNNIQWIYCMDYSGHVIFQSPVKAKTISATKSSEPYERAPIDSNTYASEQIAAASFAGFIPGTTQMMNPSGMFGHDTEGVIWQDPQGNYYEWHLGPYFVSSIPLKLKDPVITTEVDNDLYSKEQMIENGTASASILN